MELFYFSKTDDKAQQSAEFLQSAEWGNFLESTGEEIIRVGVREGGSEGERGTGDKKEGKILLAATLVKKIIFNKFFYWYAPRGPIIYAGEFSDSVSDSGRPGYNEVLEFFFQELKKLDRRALFLRFEPLKFKEREFSASEFLFKKTINLQPAQTLILDLNLSEEELLAAMHQKTRYNIRLAEKKGIVIKESAVDKIDVADYAGAADSADLKEFWRLLKTTGERDNFRLHSFSHYEKLLAVNRLVPGFVKLFLAQYEGKNIAAGIFLFYGDQVTYLHGASDNQFRNLMAPYLLQWSLIKYARTEKYRFYDFYGIDEKKWPGVTRFKLGFGGRVVNYPGTYDLIFKPFIYRCYEFLRKLRRFIK